MKVLLAGKLQISRIPSCGGESQDDDVIHPHVGVSECFFSQGYSITVRVRLVSHFDAAWYLFHFHISRWRRFQFQVVVNMKYLRKDNVYFLEFIHFNLERVIIPSEFSTNMRLAF